VVCAAAQAVDTEKSFTQLQNGSDIRGIAIEGEPDFSRLTSSPSCQLFRVILGVVSTILKCSLWSCVRHTQCCMVSDWPNFCLGGQNTPVP